MTGSWEVMAVLEEVDEVGEMKWGDEVGEMKWGDEVGR